MTGMTYKRHGKCDKGYSRECKDGEHMGWRSSLRRLASSIRSSPNRLMQSMKHKPCDKVRETTRVSMMDEGGKRRYYSTTKKIKDDM